MYFRQYTRGNYDVTQSSDTYLDSHHPISQHFPHHIKGNYDVTPSSDDVTSWSLHLDSQHLTIIARHATLHKHIIPAFERTQDSDIILYYPTQILLIPYQQITQSQLGFHEVMAEQNRLMKCLTAITCIYIL